LARYTKGGHLKVRIPDSVRREVALRYGCPPGGTVRAPCAYCGRLDEITWFKRDDGRPSFWVVFGRHHLDHVIPECQGGKSVADNITLACEPCNLSKGGKSAAAFLARRRAAA
jgi:5-methylcytosine-specific restriction endonuclease McrA